MLKEKLIKLRCKAWGITEDKYYCNQCGDFSLEDMAKAYRRGKNQGRKQVADLEKENTELKDKLNNLSSVAEQKEKQIQKLKRDKQNLRAELRIARNNLQVKDTAYQLAMEEISCIQTDFNTFKSEAKDIIRNLLRVTYGEGWNYSLDVKVKAEKFLEEEL